MLSFILFPFAFYQVFPHRNNKNKKYGHCLCGSPVLIHYSDKKKKVWQVSFSCLHPFSLRWDHTFRTKHSHRFNLLRNLGFIQYHHSWPQDWVLYDALSCLSPLPKGPHAVLKTEVKTYSFPKKASTLRKREPDLIYWSAVWDTHMAEISAATF